MEVVILTYIGRPCGVDVLAKNLGSLKTMASTSATCSITLLEHGNMNVLIIIYNSISFQKFTYTICLRKYHKINHMKHLKKKTKKNQKPKKQKKTMIALRLRIGELFQSS
jgi:hypothetical protein